MQTTCWPKPTSPKASLIMAKKKAAKVNKSKEIRDYKRAHPNHTPKVIAEALGKKGIEVSAQFVSTVLSTSKKKKVIGKPGRPKGSTKSAGARRATNGAVSFESLLRVKEIVDEMGSVDEARSALEALEQLMD